jgi:uncharacterized membrane protein YhiD involved in acid resistance
LLTTIAAEAASVPMDILARLAVATALGAVVAWVYRRARRDHDPASTFPPTLVLLAVLIAMVTQVIGDNVARAFSLVGALSIVRFRTVVRDTQDTAYLICAVVVGMAIGAGHPWVAFIGLGVVSVTAFAMAPREAARRSTGPAFVVKVRTSLGADATAAIERALDELAGERRLIAVSTARQGLAIDTAYEVRLRPDRTPDALVRTINRLEGVVSVDVERGSTEVPAAA